MISQHEAIRLLRNIIGEPTGDPKAHFVYAVGNGLAFMPDLDLQDVATLARLWSGEAIATPGGGGL